MSSVTFYPMKIKCFVEKNVSFLDIALENYIELDHNCAGVCACTSCRILIKQGKEYLNKISEDEIFILESENKYGENIRLACQCKIISGNNPEIIVEIPDEKC
jgi:2Fe-2S ferredoxin